MNIMFFLDEHSTRHFFCLAFSFPRKEIIAGVLSIRLPSFFLMNLTEMFGGLSSNSKCDILSLFRDCCWTLRAQSANVMQ